MKRTLGILGAALAGLFLSGEARSESPERIPSWAAPPYWTPSAPKEAGREEAPERSALGRAPLAVGPAALPFFALVPCRLVDTRTAVSPPMGGGFLPPATVRSYTLTGACNVPAGAKAISLNATVVNPTGPGFLVLYAEGGSFPAVSTLNYVAGETIANAAVVPLSATGGISMALGVSGGDVILDTNGYYAPAPGVTSLNALTGDVTLAAGTNVTLTPSGTTLTIASTAGGGAPTGAAGGSLSGTYPNPGIADGAVTDAKVASVSWGKVTGAPGFVLKTGDTMTGSLTVNPGNVYLTASSASSGNIFKNGLPFLHNFGSGNTFVGAYAGNFTMTGSSNTASGFGALYSNTSGYSNTASGFQALYSNTTGYYNTASGMNALTSNTTGYNNTASGTGALASNTAGASNTASGYLALALNTTASSNTASGYAALYSNTTGGSNTASGYQALYANTTGSENTASGINALHSNTTGNYNTASGSQALYSNTTGTDNTASGWAALGSNSGNQNTAVGNASLTSNTTGFQNTAVGDQAGYRSGAGTGYTGGITYVPNSTGSYNTFIGRGTGTTANNLFNCTAVGIDAYCDGNNQVRLGNPFVVSIGGMVGWSSLSDARAKKDVRDLDLGLDFVRRLRPVAYRMTLGNDRTDMGFLAQDVEALLGEGYNVLSVGGDESRTLSLRYTDLIAPLVKAVQEQQETIRRDQTEIDGLKERLGRLERLLDALLPTTVIRGDRP